MKPLLTVLFRLIEILFAPITLLSALWFKIIVRAQFARAVVSERILMMVGILPVDDHYYQPMVNPRRHLRHPLTQDRNLPGIDLNTPAQLELLSKYNYNNELLQIQANAKKETLSFDFNNIAYGPGDSEFLYSLIRHFKPSQMIEIGSGYSTLISIRAFEENKRENSLYKVNHMCVEPYEQPWLERTSATIIREKVENLGKDFFMSLNENDILFIDSSHVIRAQGDVLFEYLEILPVLKKGVIVHIHDIFTPKDYPEAWVLSQHRLWNEQYLLDAFLTLNPSYEIIAALNYLTHNHWESVAAKFPVLDKEANTQPGSFWIKKIK